MINVTKPYLPNVETYKKYIDAIWESGHLTNNGQFCKKLEKELCDFLSVDNCIYVNNGTIALQIALKTLSENKNEIITTPFSYVATTNSILWEGYDPIFCDINDSDFCIDSSKIENKITNNTVAILSTHVFGNPCDVEEIEKIGKRYNIKVIYDGAHAFGTSYRKQSLLSYGDISICSFHATKLFHTAEGGCIFTNEKSLIDKMVLFRQFGHIGDNYLSIGINGKSSELHAAMGLCILPEINNIINKRREISEIYDFELDSGLKKPIKKPHTNYNYAYYPVKFENENQLLVTVKSLNEKNIFPRRYFHPSLNKLPYLKENISCPISDNVAETILCLPLYFNLTSIDVKNISKIINDSL